MNKTFQKALNVALAVAFAAGLSMAGLSSTSARVGHTHAAAKLPVLKTPSYVSPDLSLAASLDPSQISAATDYSTIYRTFRGLVSISPSGTVMKELAKSISVSKNRKVYTFTIRPAKFFDGHTVTAPDFVYSIKRALRAPGTQVNYYDEDGFGDIKGADDYANNKSDSLPGVKALSKNKLQITITKPISYFLEALTYPINDVLDPAIVRGQSSAATGNFLTTNCPGARANATGQFTFQCSGNNFFPSGETPRYTLVPNAKYYGRKAHVILQRQAVGSVETCYNEYQSGAVDTGCIPAAHLPAWKKNPRGQLNPNPGPNCPHPTAGCPSTTIRYLNVATKSAPFDNQDCRLALSYGLDRKGLAKIYNGAEAPLYTITPAGLGIMSPSVVKTIQKKVPTYNASKAASYMAKCPAANKSTTFTMIYPSGSASTTALATAMQAQVKAMGFTNFQIKGLPTNEWLHDVNTPMSQTGIQVTYGGWLDDYPDPQDYVSILFTCGAGYNIGEYCNKKATKLAQQGDVESNKAKRIQDYLKAQTLMLNGGSPIMMFVDVNFGLIKKYVHGLKYSVALGGFVPKNNDMSYLKISKH